MHLEDNHPGLRVVLDLPNRPAAALSGLAASLDAAPLGDAEGDIRFADLVSACRETDGLAAFADAIAADTPAGRLLRGIAAGSPFLFGLCLADPARLSRLLASPPEASLDQALDRARRACDEAASPTGAMQALRHLKQEAALLVALADLGGVWDVPAVTAALTRTADAAVSNALRVLLRDAATAGRLAPADADDPEAGSGFIVLAMGKHGAFELNYSSDIDLIVLYDPDILPLREGLEPGALLRAHHPGSGQDPFGAHGRRLRLPRRPAPAAGSRRDRRGHLAAGRLRLLRKRRPELGARRADQGAALRRRYRRGASAFSPPSRPSSGASISTTPPSPTSTR